MRRRPDDPEWLLEEPDIRLMDLQVLRQAGIPEPLLFLALREEGPAVIPYRGHGPLGARDHGIPFVDVDDEPYWEDETDPPHHHHHRGRHR